MPGPLASLVNNYRHTLSDTTGSVSVVLARPTFQKLASTQVSQQEVGGILVQTLPQPYDPILHSVLPKFRSSY